VKSGSIVGGEGLDSSTSYFDQGREPWGRLEALRRMPTDVRAPAYVRRGRWLSFRAGAPNQASAVIGLPPDVYDLLTEAEIAKLATWLAKAGLEDGPRPLVEGFATVQSRADCARVMLLIDTLPPIPRARVPLGAREAEARSRMAAPPKRRRTLADKPSLSALDQRRVGVAPTCDRGPRPVLPSRSFRRRSSELCRDHQPLRRRWRDQRDGCVFSTG
jgi:hypothetical protein